MAVGGGDHGRRIGRWLALPIALVLAALAIPTVLPAVMASEAFWLIGVTAVAAAAVLLRRLGWLRAEAPPEGGPTGREGEDLFGQWRTVAEDGFRTAFVRWVPSPSTGRPFAHRLLGRRPWADWARGVAPWALAFGIFWIAVASVPETLDVHEAVVPFLAGLIALPGGLSRRYALLGWRLAMVLAIVVAFTGTSSAGRDPGTWPVIELCVWLAMMFLVSVRHDRATALWVYAATVATLAAGLRDNGGAAVGLMVAASALLLIGDLVRSRRLARQEVERQTGLGELEKARRTVLEERSRIARDLHDVVAHHMSMVVVQSETAPYRLGNLSEEVRTEFTAISTSAREALTEIRSLLGVLRSEEHTVTTAPQPSFDRIPELIEGATSSGMPVEFTTTGTLTDVGAATGLTAYRIVQEALANVARHAPGAPVTVGLDHRDAALQVRVTNGPSGAPSVPGLPGHGLVGMRERAHAVGGSLQTGPQPDGGFQVLAVLPTNHQEPAGEQ